MNVRGLNFVSIAVAGRFSRKNSALIVGKGEAGEKFDQGRDENKPGDDDRQPGQGEDDDAAPGRALEASPDSYYTMFVL
jgi:hypothetical protein